MKRETVKVCFKLHNLWGYGTAAVEATNYKMQCHGSRPDEVIELFQFT
jgi:hypothetical protein